MVEPLTREERDTFLRDDSFARRNPTRVEEWRRWDATVRAEEAGRKAAEERAEDERHRRIMEVDKAEQRADALRAAIARERERAISRRDIPMIDRLDVTLATDDAKREKE